MDGMGAGHSLQRGDTVGRHASSCRCGQKETCPPVPRGPEGIKGYEVAGLGAGLRLDTGKPPACVLAFRGLRKQGPRCYQAGQVSWGTLSLVDPCPTTTLYSPLSEMWRTMFPATPSSSTWHGRRGRPTLASWGSRRRNRRHMTGGTGRSVGTLRGSSGSPRTWSRAAAGPKDAGAGARVVEGSKSRRRRWSQKRWQTGSIFLEGGVQDSQRSPLCPGPVG